MGHATGNGQLADPLRYPLHAGCIGRLAFSVLGQLFQIEQQACFQADLLDALRLAQQRGAEEICVCARSGDQCQAAQTAAGRQQMFTRVVDVA